MNLGYTKLLHVALPRKPCTHKSHDYATYFIYDLFTYSLLSFISVFLSSLLGVLDGDLILSGAVVTYHHHHHPVRRWFISYLVGYLPWLSVIRSLHPKGLTCKARADVVIWLSESLVYAVVFVRNTFTYYYSRVREFIVHSGEWKSFQTHIKCTQIAR